MFHITKVAEQIKKTFPAYFEHKFCRIIKVA